MKGKGNGNGVIEGLILGGGGGGAKIPELGVQSHFMRIFKLY